MKHYTQSQLILNQKKIDLSDPHVELIHAYMLLSLCGMLFFYRISVSKFVYDQLREAFSARDILMYYNLIGRLFIRVADTLRQLCVA